jgi:hypothetical protein
MSNLERPSSKTLVRPHPARPPIRPHRLPPSQRAGSQGPSPSSRIRNASIWVRITVDIGVATRKVNAGHMSRDCPDRIEAERKKEVKKESVSALEASVVESDSDSEYSVPTINVDVEVQDVPIPAALVDTGSTVNLIDKVTVASRNLRTQACKPILLRQACSLRPIPVRSSVSSKVEFPSVKWESTKSHKFFAHRSCKEQGNTRYAVPDCGIPRDPSGSRKNASSQEVGRR